MAQALVKRIGSQFKATVNVQANPGSTITLTSSGKTFSAVADSTTGIASVLVKKKGTYTISTNCSAGYFVEYNTSSVEVTQNKASYTAQMVKMNVDLGTVSCRNDYRPNQLAVCWTGDNPTSYFTGVRLGYSTTGATTEGTLVTKGAGNSLTIWKSTGNVTVKGLVHSGLTENTTYYYSLRPYIIINGAEYYATGISGYQTSGKAVNHTATITVTANPSATITATRTSGIYGNATYTATANSTTGVATLTITEYGVFSIATNTSANANSIGYNANAITHTAPSETTTRQLVKVNTGTINISTAVYSNLTTAFCWGSSGTSPAPNAYFTNYMVRWGTSKPNSPTAGTQLYEGKGSALVINTSTTRWGATHTGTANTTYYYRVYPYVTINGTKYYANVDYSASKKCEAVSLNTSIKSTGNWTVPTGVRKITYFLVGGGGGGGYGYKVASSQGGGGGAGGYVTTGTISVTPGQVFACTIGAGGAGSSSNGTAGTTGGTTKFGSYTANGGGGGTANGGGGTGGTGGGGAGLATSTSAGNGGAGGSNGGNGTAGKKGTSSNSNGGSGDGKSKYAYGGSSGTLYAGGGGGGADAYYSGSQYQSTTKASGGSGGGGAGGYNTATSSYVAPTAGTANTGSGGGGAISIYTANVNGASGGSGIILVKAA